MKVYLAGMLSTIKTRKAQAAELRVAGIKVTSHWIDETVPYNVEMKDIPEVYHAETAVIDIQDIDDCDVFVEFVPTDTELVDATLRSSSRGGHHFEMGYAYATGKRVMVVGDKENVFHYLPRIEHFATWAEAKFVLVAIC